MISSWDYNKIVLDGWPGWDKDNDTGEPFYHFFDKCLKETASYNLAVWCDDNLEDTFYYRDFTEDGMPFAYDDFYSSLFAFKRHSDYLKFIERVE